MEFELEPPDSETAALLEAIAGSPAMRPADPMHVRFYSRSKKSEERSRAEKRPIFEPVEYIEILTPGDKDTIVDRPVRVLDRYIYAGKYQAFRKGAQQEDGTPLSVWGGVTPERVEELAHFRIKTVEQLASVADGNVGNLGMHARAERQKAIDYLAVMKGNAPVAKLQAENDGLRARLEALEALATRGAPAAVESDAASKPKRVRNRKTEASHAG